MLACLVVIFAWVMVGSRSQDQSWRDVGAAIDVAIDRPQLTDIGTHALIIVRTDRQLIALNRRDSHPKGCLVTWRAERNELADPCLGTRYRQDGSYIAGPAPRDLDRYPVQIADGRIAVNIEQPIRGAVRNAGLTFWERLRSWFTSVFTSQ